MFSSLMSFSVPLTIRGGSVSATSLAQKFGPLGIVSADSGVQILKIATDLFAHVAITNAFNLIYNFNSLQRN